ncbi:hypothetical protein K439DRAFT_1397152 [Ramaria rubella]|nr:hypothetical protein K439DRAFT_1397152 [Ramaria rubella]
MNGSDSFDLLGIDFKYEPRRYPHYCDPMGWRRFPAPLSSTPTAKYQGQSWNRKFLREKMKGKWQEDVYFYQKHFPLQTQGRAYADRIMKNSYQEAIKRWKRIPNKPKSADSITTPLHILLNTILKQSHIPATRRTFFRPKPNSMKATRDPLPSPNLVLTNILSCAERPPMQDYSSGLVPVQVMLESDYKKSKRHLSAVHANEIFQQQDNRRYIYALIITESFVRTFMFDPAGCAVAPRLDYHAQPAEFCAMIAGIASLDEVKAGFDTSYSITDKSETRILITEPHSGKPSSAVPYRVVSRLFKAERFVSRATVCWLVERDDEPRKYYVIKDAWIAPSETQNEMEGSLIAHANRKGVVRGLVRVLYQGRVKVPGRADDTVVKNRRIRGGALTDGMLTVQDRVHTRIVMDTYGKPIYKFSNRRELLLAFHDVIQAHRNLYQIAEILHRDVSIGNILINNDPQAVEGDRGILIDLDFAVRLEKLAKGPRSVGTRRFMSHNLLQSWQQQRHSYLDDLESFYYVLCWMVCIYDGPGDQHGSHIEETPPVLAAWDARDEGAAKRQHMHEEFSLPVQPYFGDAVREMTMRLHDFFKYRTRGDGPSLDVNRDYDEFIGYVKTAIQHVEPEDVIDPGQLSLVLEQESLSNRPRKRKASEIMDSDVLQESKIKSDSAARGLVEETAGIVAQRPRRSKANYTRATTTATTRKRRK